MTDCSPYLTGIGERREEAARLVCDWARVSSGSRSPAGLRVLLRLLEKEFGVLGAQMRRRPLRVPAGPAGEEPSLGQALSVRMRPEARVRVLLVGHMDTVAAGGGDWERVERRGDTLLGPGVADAKGGLGVMLEALLALERSPWAGGVGWEVLINPDEEIGSPGSTPLLQEAAARCHLGLVFEPALAGGALVGARKGSGAFTAAVRGRAAHAGREPEKGRNAIVALARFILGVTELDGTGGGITVNVGHVEGGGPINIVPDRAVCRFNVRVPSAEDLRCVEESLDALTNEANRADGISMELSGGFGRPPRTIDAASLRVYEELSRCGAELGARVGWEASGGASDANTLGGFGLPVADGLGPEGGDLHTPREHMSLPSLVDRARLVASFLMKLGSGEIDGSRFRIREPDR